MALEEEVEGEVGDEEVDEVMAMVGLAEEVMALVEQAAMVAGEEVDLATIVVNLAILRAIVPRAAADEVEGQAVVAVAVVATTAVSTGILHVTAPLLQLDLLP